MTCEEIAGGTDSITVRSYRSAKGNKIALWIEDGFPDPELEIFDLMGSTINEDFVAELTEAFAQFHNKKFRYYPTTRSHVMDMNGDSYRLKATMQNRT